MTILSEFRETGGSFCAKNKTGFSHLFPHYCHKKLIQMREVKKMGAALALTASRCVSVCPSTYVYYVKKRMDS